MTTKPERVDAVIIGAGASGAAAAKVLTERGLRVVALEKGPWRTKESFGGDELANGAAKAAIIEPASKRRVGVETVAVVVARLWLAHATSLRTGEAAPDSTGDEANRRAHACRVRSR